MSHFCTSFRSAGTRAVCTEPQMFNLSHVWLGDTGFVISSQTGLPPSTTTLPKDCKLHLPVLKSDVGLPRKVKKRKEGGCWAETYLLVLYICLQNCMLLGDSTCCETVPLSAHHFSSLYLDVNAADTWSLRETFFLLLFQQRTTVTIWELKHTLWTISPANCISVSSIFLLPCSSGGRKRGEKKTRSRGRSKNRLHWKDSVANAVLRWCLNSLFFTIQFVTPFLRKARGLSMWFPLAESTPSRYFSQGILEGVHAATH